MMQELPKYYETFIPILEILRDGKIIHYNELRKAVRDKFYSDLPQELLTETTKSGDLLILNRIGWGKAYLKQAGMVHQPSKAMVQITKKGLAILDKGSISLKELKEDLDFLAHRKAQAIQLPFAQSRQEDQTPQDMIDAGMQSIEDEVKSDILEKLKSVDPYYFEKIVNELFEKMGYGGANTTVKSGDGGIDGVINQDELGLEKIYIQAKRYNGHSVREPEIRNFIGAMSGDTQKGIFVTTSSFDSRAIEKAEKAIHKIVLIDGQQLADLMYKHGIGVQISNTYDIKSLDEDYFV